MVLWLGLFWLGLNVGSAPSGLNFEGSNYRAYAALGRFDPIVNAQMMEQSLEREEVPAFLVVMVLSDVVAIGLVIYVCTRR